MEIHPLKAGKKIQVFLGEVFVKMLTCLFSLWQIVRIYRLFVHITLIPLSKTCFKTMKTDCLRLFTCL